MIRAASQLQEQRIAEPVLIGNRKSIEATCEQLGLGFEPEIVDPGESKCEAYADRLHELRQRKGVTRNEADELIRRDTNYFGSVMVERGDADALLTGLTHHYPSALRAPLQVIGTAEDADYAAGVYMLAFEGQVVFVADATVNQDPDEEVLTEVTLPC